MSADVETLRGLLERVRSATEASRELDGDLWAVVVGRVWRYPLSGPWIDDPHRPVPSLTTSIDDALALILAVLPGSGWSILQEPRVPPHHPRATVFQGPLFSSGDAATPALALCAALLQVLIVRAEADHG